MQPTHIMSGNELEGAMTLALLFVCFIIFIAIVEKIGEARGKYKARQAERKRSNLRLIDDLLDCPSYGSE